MKIGYVTSPQFRRLKQSNMQKFNRRAVENYRAEVASAGVKTFDALASERLGRAELAAKQMVKRIQGQAQAKLASLKFGSLLNKSS